MKRDYLAWAALAAALVVTASAEYALARAAGFGEWTAAGVPAALDIYAVRAMRAHRDVPAVVTAMILVNAAAHMVEAGLLTVSWPLVVGVSAIAPLVLWRVHRLAEQPIVSPIEAAVEQPAVVTAPPITAPAAPRAEVTTAPPAEVPRPDPVEQSLDDTGPQRKPLVICGAAQAHTLDMPTLDTADEVTKAPAERLPTDAARIVLESCWEKGTSPGEAARLATRSATYAKKVFARLDDDRGHSPVAGQLALVSEGMSA